MANRHAFGGSDERAAADEHDLPQLREAVSLAAGDEHLPRADLIEHKILPLCVKLRKHIVEQQQRLLAGVAPHQLALGELEADGRGARLPLRAVALDVPAADGGLKIVLVRAGQALPGVQLRDAP